METLSFAREYINDPKSRTREQEEQIRKAYWSCFHRQLRIGCHTCYIEAIFEIQAYMEKEPCKYKLKPGALLQDFYGDKPPVTDKTITDELAEYYLRTNPGLAKYFAYIPPVEQELEIFATFESMTKGQLMAHCDDHYPEEREQWEKMKKNELIDYLNSK